MNIVFYLINLDGSDERLASAARQLNADGVDFLRISAVDGRQRAPQSFPGYDELRAKSYMGRSMKGGEMGCYQSHVLCVDRFLADSSSDYAVVIEDDVLWPVGTKEKIIQLLDLLEKIPEGFDIVNIGFNKNKIYSKLKSFNDFLAVHAHYFPMTTTSIIWSKNGAKAFKQEVPIIYAPIDNALREWQCQKNKGYATMPPLVSITNAENEIDANSTVSRSNTGRGEFYRLKKHWRLFKQKTQALKNKFNYS